MFFAKKYGLKYFERMGGALKLCIRCAITVTCAVLLSACSAAPPGVSLQSASITPEIMAFSESSEAASFVAEDKAYLNIIPIEPDSVKDPLEQVVELKKADNYTKESVDGFLRGIVEPEESEDARNVIEAMSAYGTDLYSASFTVTYLSDELLSCIVTFDESGGDMLPVTIRRDTGERLVLSDFFTKNDQGWRALLAEIVTNAALDEGMTLLCDVMPVDDARPFFILDGDIVLFYRTYEIATYESGLPCFILPMDSLNSYLRGAYGVGVAGLTEQDAIVESENTFVSE